MLIIDRKEGQSVKIGGDVVVTIRKLASGHVSLAIHAPRNIAIERDNMVKTGKECVNCQSTISKNTMFCRFCGHLDEHKETNGVTQ